MIIAFSIVFSFIIEPKIFLDGQSSLVKHFAPNRTRGNFIVNIYTTTPLSSFEIRKPSGEPTEFLFALISYPTFEILAKYQVDLPQLDSEISGQYVISVTNEEGGMESQRITIIKAQSECGHLISLCHVIPTVCHVISIMCHVIQYWVFTTVCDMLLSAD